MQEKYQTLNRSFARRIGNNLRGKDLSSVLLEIEKLKFKINDLKNEKYKNIFLEIGYGDGSHIANMAINNPQNLYIGSEVFLDGTNKLLINIEKNNIDNITLWPEDIDELMPHLPKASLNGIYILFPDPWPKKRQHKKRLFNKIRKDIFKSKLKQDAFIIFASDISDYFESTIDILSTDHEFDILQNDNFKMPHNGYGKTKYHKKAENEGRVAQFVTAIRRYSNLS